LVSSYNISNDLLNGVVFQVRGNYYGVNVMGETIKKFTITKSVYQKLCGMLENTTEIRDCGELIVTQIEKETLATLVAYVMTEHRKHTIDQLLADLA
jgi:hypothetical protein